MDETEVNRQLVQYQQEYLEFLDDVNGDSSNVTKVKSLIQEEGTRLMININDLRKKNPERCARLLENGFEEMPLFQKALRDLIHSIDTDYAKKVEEFFIGLEGSFGSKHVTPRSLTSHFLGNTVCVEGIVTKCSLIQPKVVRSVHWCSVTKAITNRRYADVSSFDVMPSVNVYPTKDDEGNLLETEYGHSKYRDHQTITIQEMPEKAPTGQLPRSLDIILDNDLVDLCKPGDRVLIVGVYRCLPGKHGGFTSGVFKAVLLATNITLLHKDPNLRILLTESTEFERFSKTAHPFRTLARSLAPSIHGHDFIKKAVLSLLLGGQEKILANGTRLRGDINVLLIGDPSVAKSQMLRYVSNVAPRVVMTTGRGSSGVGLTAAVTTDMETGDRRLEAGAMVLADRGIVCIDEFDKMSDADRTAIHEVMEQGRVTIAKAGIHARLNARTSVLAAANPIYGRYDEYKSPMDNIGLQDSLLSRFDLLFIVLDTAEPEQDRLIADHVLRMHRYRNPAEQDGEATPLFQNDMTLSTQDPNAEATQAKQAPTYEKHDPLLHGKYRNRNDKILSMEFIKKYIHLAKCINPKLSEPALKEISEAYARLRSMNLEDASIARTQPITARSMETMIRLATAQARARMSRNVTKADAEEAIALLEYACFKRVLEKEKKRKLRVEDDSEPESDEEAVDVGSGDENDDGDGDGPRRSSKRRRRETADDGSEGIPSDGEGSEPARPSVEPTEEPEKEVDSVAMDVEPAAGVPREISDERYPRFKTSLSALFEMEREESLTQKKVTEWLTAEKQNFTETEVLGGFDRLVAEDKIMVADGLIFLMN